MAALERDALPGNRVLMVDETLLRKVIQDARADISREAGWVDWHFAVVFFLVGCEWLADLEGILSDVISLKILLFIHDLRTLRVFIPTRYIIPNKLFPIRQILIKLPRRIRSFPCLQTTLPPDTSLPFFLIAPARWLIKLLWVSV